ncbi:unnamed protein product [Soboliphyme baturini]|uniref:GST N-terminal domain-containing protein n=1 Tax=Soboliphyme baturini TaxID=241478 RepID=A0A183ICD4_9BILA|nr:unnamed protein product [Soboliphyme baturini]
MLICTCILVTDFVGACSMTSEGDCPIELWVRAGCDGVRLGGCPLCHQVFMTLLIKGQDHRISFKVKTTNPYKAQPEFRALGFRHVPAFVHDDVLIDQPDEILEYIDKILPVPDLQYHNSEADSAVKDLFSKFCFYIKSLSKDPAHLEAGLRKLDEFLEKNNTTYLCGPNVTHLDCQILPKLHQMRIVLKYIKNYEMPSSLRSLWKYLEAGYNIEAFRLSCPCDEEIILHWVDRPEVPNVSSSEYKRLSRGTTTYSFHLSA